MSVDTNSQETALEEALVRVVDEDASLETRIDTETGEMLLSGMGELHLQVAVDRLTRALPFEIHCSKPRVAYRETASSDGERIEVLNTTIGSAHLSASLSVSIRPIEGDNVVDVSGFSGDDADAIKEGAHAALGRGAMLGAPVTSTHLHISRPDDGESSSQSSAAALRTCTSKAVTTLLRDCSPTLLEPVMRVTCRVPDSSSGEVLSELSHPIRRRGIVEGVEACGDGWNNVSAIVPVEGLLGWSTRMRSMTKGRGDFEAIYENYRAVDAATQKRILAERSGV